VFYLFLTAAPAAAQSTTPESSSASLDDQFNAWKAAYEAQGGDADVTIGLAPMRGLSDPYAGSGSMQLDMLSGSVGITVTEVTQPLDIWLIDNQDGGQSLLPEAGDILHQLGTVSADSPLTAELGAGFFSDFELDLVVATPAGADPALTQQLFGSRSAFQRRYTAERLAAAAPDGQQQPELAKALQAAGAATGDPVLDDPRVQLGLVSPAVLRGAQLFFRETFEGNGRTCGTCHRAEENLVISRDFVSRLAQNNPLDPLFIAEEQFGERQIPDLERPDLLRQFGLIVENVDGLEDPVNKFTLRAITHNLSLATSLLPPLPNADTGELPDGTSTAVFSERTGWSGDGAPGPGTARMFPVGAVIQHATRDLFIRTPGPDSFRLPTDQELDDMEAYLLSVGRLNELNLSTVQLKDADAERGRVLFNTGVGGAKCSGCHGNAGANSSFGGNRNFNTGVEQVRLAVLNSRGVPCDGGFGGQGEAPASDAGCAADTSDGRGDGTFNTPPLIEAADTGPFFHTNAFNTIEEAVEFYSSDAFNNSPGGQLLINAQGEGINLDRRQSRDVAAFLRVLNAAFNLDMASQRLDAARQINNAFDDSQSALVSGLLELASEELRDASQVLSERRLSAGACREIGEAIQSTSRALRTITDSRAVSFNTGRAQSSASRAKRALGSNLTLTMGEGNLVFGLDIGDTTAPPDDDTPPPDDGDDDTAAELTANFDAGAEGFSFTADAEDPRYSSGGHSGRQGVNNSGALSIQLGGVDNRRVTAINGRWSIRFSGAGTAILALQANLMQSPHYERDETSEARVHIDDQVFVISRLQGDGDGGRFQVTGFRQLIQQIELAPGEHSLTLECFNNQKTARDEFTVCQFDELSIH
jgi:mono/diheme cytochrome c family protein